MSNNTKGFAALQNFIIHAKPMCLDVFHAVLFLIFIMFLYEFFWQAILYNSIYIIKGDTDMTKTIKNLALTLTVISACACSCFADGNAFTPLNFDDTVYGIRTSAVTSAPAQTPAGKTEIPTGNTKMQNAITQLDNAQVEVRNELLNIKTQYADIDAKYQTLKTERKALDKQIKSIERRINKIDRQKENIRKNML